MVSHSRAFSARTYAGMDWRTAGWTCSLRHGGRLISCSSGNRENVSWTRLWIGRELKCQIHPVCFILVNSARSIRIWSLRGEVHRMRWNFSTKATTISPSVLFTTFQGKSQRLTFQMMTKCSLFLVLTVMFEFLVWMRSSDLCEFDSGYFLFLDLIINNG